MDIEKMLVKLDGKEYSFSVEVMQDDDETIYRVTPDQGERVLDDISPGYLEYDDKGHIVLDERALNDQAKAIATAIWDALKLQIIPADKNPEQ